MAEATQPPKVKLICGMISAEAALFEEAGKALAERFGDIDITSEVMDFDFTHYYDDEMGRPLYRRFVSFAELVSPDMLASAKPATNSLEKEFASRREDGPARPINLDPGYVELSKLVLASMKDFSHRIYLGQGVYAEVTLMYQQGRWRAFEWTFPDFASSRYHPFLCRVREALVRQRERTR